MLCGAAGPQSLEREASVEGDVRELALGSWQHLVLTPGAIVVSPEKCTIVIC